jgi:hypothetical protein
MQRESDIRTKPLNAYQLFARDKRGSVSNAMPGASVSDVSRELGRLWTEMADVGKAPYEAGAQHQMARYRGEEQYDDA